MKSARLLDILLRLQLRSPRTARELAKELGVTERTIYRDVDALAISGVPVFTTRGATGGIHITPGFRQSIARLSEDEVRALFTSGQDPLADLGWGEQLQDAREKLYGALSDRQRLLASKTQERIFVESRQWMRNAQPTAMLKILRTAVWDNRSIRMRYRNQAGAISRREVDPLGLVFKAGVWYLVARTRERMASYRAERVLRAEILQRAFIRPANFKLADYWEESSARYERTAKPIEVIVAGSRRHIRQLSGFWPVQFYRLLRGNQTAQVTFPLRGIAIHELVAWSAELEVLEPADIVSEVRLRLRAGAGRYGL